MDFILNDKLHSFKFRRYNFLPGKPVGVSDGIDISDLLKHTKVKPVGAILRKEVTPLVVEKVPKENQLTIGVLRVGGIGDTLQLGAHCKAIKRRFPASFLTAYVRDKIDVEVMESNKWIDKVCQVGVSNWDLIVERESKKHDIFYDFRYAVKVIFNTKDHSEYREKTEKKFSEYETIYKDFCKSNYKIEKFGINLIDFSNMVACLEGNEDDMTFDLVNNYCSHARILEKQKYVTIHVSFGKFRKTKSWLLVRWAGIVKYLISIGYTVVQVGIKGEPLIEGALDLLGLSNLQETAWILQGSQYHIDTEGGLVHLAKAVKTPSIVIFGSTPVESFGYKNNINLRSSECPPCWYKTEDWYMNCSEGHEIPKCLDLVTFDMVKGAIDDFEIKYPKKRNISNLKTNENPLVSIVIPVYNQVKYLTMVVNSILTYTKKIDFEFIIVDNGSGLEVKEYLNSLKQFKMFNIITNDKNLGFSKANNQGAKKAQGKYICFLNSDIEVGEGWLATLIQGIEESDKLGMVGVSGGTLDKECRCTGIVNSNSNIYNYLEGWCLLIYKKLFDSLNGFDEDFSPAFSEDADLSYRVKRSGYKIRIVERVAIRHYGNKTVYSQNDFDVTKVSKDNSIKLKDKIAKYKKEPIAILNRTKV